MTRRYPHLVARARLLGADASLAEDLVQSALIATFSRPRDLRTEGEAEAYVKRVIVHEFFDLVTRKRSERERWEHASAAAPHAGDPTSAHDLRLDLAAALTLLPPRERACVTLRYLDDLDIQQTAAVLRVSPGAVKRYVHDGLGRLNSVMGTNASIDDPVAAPVTAPRGGVR